MRWQPLAAQAKVDSLRSHYIQEYPDRFFVWPVIKQRQLSFEVVDKEEDQGEVQFIPNNEFTMGLGFYVLELGFEVTFGIPLNEKNKEIYGESKARDWQLNILGKKWGADVYYQKYTGYYINDSRTSIPSGQPFPQRPDISTTNFGVSGVYIFNHRRFSLRSSYTYAERQLKSKGSFLLYGTLNSFTLSADSAILTEPVQAELGTGSDFKSLRYTTLSFAPGYSYNLIWRKLFLNGSLTVGPAHHWVRYEEQNGNVRDDISINSTASLRFAVGYNSDRVFGGIGISGQTRIVTFEDIKFSNSSVLFKAVIGYRFREFGFLKKRVWDFVPFL
jgi:hypothetical protein